MCITFAAMFNSFGRLAAAVAVVTPPPLGDSFGQRAVRYLFVCIWDVGAKGMEMGNGEERDGKIWSERGYAPRGCSEQIENL